VDPEAQMTNVPDRVSDHFEVVLHCDAFRCHVCADEPTFLYRVCIQEWPTGPYALEEDERFVIRCRLVCDRCLRTFVCSERAASVFATIAGKTWCLRQCPSHQPQVYIREHWFRYVDDVRRRRLI